MFATKIQIWLCAALLSASAAGALAGGGLECKPACEEGEKRKEDRKEEHKDDRDDDRKEERKRIDWKKLSPEQREAKRKEIKQRLEERITELRAKRTNATINPQETRELNRSEQILKRFEQSAGPRPERPKPEQPAAPAPPEK